MVTKQSMVIFISMLLLISCSSGNPEIDNTSIDLTREIHSTIPPSSGPLTTDIPLSQNTPAINLYEEGPWFVYTGGELDGEDPLQHLLIVNWDGTALTNLLPGLFIWQVEVQPASDGKSGQYAAVIASNEYNDLNYRLLILHLPDGEIIKEISLVPSDPSRDVSFILTNWESLSWSPDGQKLAFSGIMDDRARLDVFVYALEDGSITRLTDQQHSQQASTLLWSPDGRYIAYESTRRGQISASSATDSIWVTRSDGSGTKLVTTDEGWANEWCFGVYLDRWLSDIELAMNCPDFGYSTILKLTVINVELGTSISVFPENAISYWGAAYAPEAQTWLIAYSENQASDRAGNMYLFHDGDWQLAGQSGSPFLTWWPERDVFITSEGLLSADGNLEEMDLPFYDAVISPDNSYWAFPAYTRYNSAYYFSYSSLKDNNVFWIGRAGEVPYTILEPLQVIEWSMDGRAVLLLDRETKWQYIAIAPDFERQLISEFMTLNWLGPWEREYPPQS